jgi:hypothetical protein
MSSLAAPSDVPAPIVNAKHEWHAWIRAIKAMQRNGNKYFIYPDAPGKRIYVGGPAEYAAYKQLHPETQNSAEKAASAASADSRYHCKQDDAVRAASARDASHPWPGSPGADLGW